MPFSNYSKSNSSSKKSKKMRRSHNKKNLMESPVPTTRDIPDIQNHNNIEEVSIEISQISMNTQRSKAKCNSKMKNPRSKKNHNKAESKKKTAACKDENLIRFADRIEQKTEAANPADLLPCQKCQRYYFDPLYDEEVLVSQVRRITHEDRSHSKRRNRRQRLLESGSIKSRKTGSSESPQKEQTKLKREPVPGCDDSHLGPYHMYKTMLKQERQHFEKINRIVYGQSDRFDGVLTGEQSSNQIQIQSNVLRQIDVNSIQQVTDSFCNDSFTSFRQEKQRTVELTLPQKKLCDLRNKIVDKMIYSIGQKLKQKCLTVHLAVKIFDLVFVQQQQYGGNHDQAVECALSLASVSKDSLKGIRNEEKNLSLLAAQSLLLASKFIEKTRIFPAEIVYQVKGWGRDDFDMLKSGYIEEHILHIIDFDLIMLSPADFLEFFVKSWSSTLPVDSCEQSDVPQKMKDFWSSEADQKKFHLHAQQICDLMVSNFGPKISLLYLPSQIATAAIHMAIKSLLGPSAGSTDTLAEFELASFIGENAKIIGYYNDSSESIQQIIKEAHDVEIIRLFLGIDEASHQQTEAKEEDDIFEKANGVWSDSPFKLAKKLQNTPVFTPNKLKSDKTLSPMKQRVSAISPCKKMRPSRQLPKISMANLNKFQTFMKTRKLQHDLRESLLSDCVSVDSFMLDNQEQFYKYPEYENSGIENNYILTHRFFGHGQYKNTKNAPKLRESIKHDKSQMRIVPTLEVISDVQKFYGNSHLKLKKTEQKKATVPKMRKIFENIDVVHSGSSKPAAGKLNMSGTTQISNTSSTASKRRVDKENKMDNANMQPPRRSELIQMRESKHFDYQPIIGCYSIPPSEKEDLEDEHVQTLFTKIVDEKKPPFRPSHPESGGDSSCDIGMVLQGRGSNPFEDNDYLHKISDLKHETVNHYSLIPRALQDQCLSDFDCTSNDEGMDFYNPFCSGQNFILSQQPSQLNFHPAPRHSMPERFINQLDDSAELQKEKHLQLC